MRRSPPIFAEALRLGYSCKKRRRRGRKIWHLTALLCRPRTFYIGMQISLFSALAASSKPIVHKSEGWGSNPARGLKMSQVLKLPPCRVSRYNVGCYVRTVRTPKATAPPTLRPHGFPTLVCLSSSKRGEDVQLNSDDANLRQPGREELDVTKLS